MNLPYLMNALIVQAVSVKLDTFANPAKLPKKSEMQIDLQQSSIAPQLANVGEIENHRNADVEISDDKLMNKKSGI